MAKSNGKQRGNGRKVLKMKGRPGSCDSDPGSGACKKRKAKVLKKGIGICLSCNVG